MRPDVAADGDRIGRGRFAGPDAAAVLERTPPEPMGTSGGVTALVRTVRFAVGPALGAALGGCRQTVVVIVVTTARGVFATASQLRPTGDRLDAEWSHRARDLPITCSEN